MFERFRRRDDDQAAYDDGRGSVALGEREREAEAETLHEREDRASFRREASPAAGADATAVRPAAKRPARRAVVADDVRELRARQRDRFGGFSWGSDFFGWLS